MLKGKIGTFLVGAGSALASMGLASAAHAAELITAPSSTEALNTVAGWSSPIFTALFVLCLIGVGLVVGGLFVSFISGKIVTAVKIALNRRKGGKRRRR